MKEEIRELGKLNKIIGDIVESFQPNRIISPYPEDTYLFSSSKVKLRPVESPSLNTDPSAGLVIEVEESPSQFLLSS